MRTIVRGTVYDSGGGTLSMRVDPDTASYIEGRVVVVYEPYFDMMDQLAARAITPEIQAVLDAAVAHNEKFVGSPVLSDLVIARLVYAVDAYLRSTRPLATSVELERGGLLRLTLDDGSTVNYDVSDPYHPTIKEQ